ncbi:hypothetical protein [Anaerosporobacter faecicola]|uniref:hypothetical protein n=1 Tax=Anaerosporobacter faecicola TaxID=2718714 RepID=UPI00143AA6C8|nr:hypothetical protein [Anaerosporobacter faecicola]
MSECEKKNEEFVPPSECICTRTKCVRHGKCEECIKHHTEVETRWAPQCMRKKKRKVVDRQKKEHII